MTISILNYNMGNIQSVAKKIQLIGQKFNIISTPNEIIHADKIILPGVGHFGKAMEVLHSLQLIDALHEAVLVKKTPILGICLGMQLMCKSSEEGNVNGLAWFDSAEIVKFNMTDTLRFKVPHMGWNQIQIKKDSILMKDVQAQSEMYFVHSYYCKTSDESIILNTTQYSHEFVSAIQKDNIFGVQYHPEKSHEEGQQIFSNFANL